MRQKPCLTSSDVHKMAAACKAEAEKNKWSVTIAIVDDAGILLYLDRLDGASAPTAEVATAKAKTSAVTRRPSKFGRTGSRTARPSSTSRECCRSRVGCRSCIRANVSARSVSPACNRTRTSRSPRPASTRLIDEKFGRQRGRVFFALGADCSCCWPGVSWSEAA